jgi:hypothetical protein
MPSVIVIDECGADLDLDNPALPSRLGTSRRHRRLLEYLILNLGYVACEVRRRSLRIQLRPSIVSRLALANVAKRLLSRPLDRVVISSFDDHWIDEIMPSAELALKRLTDLMAKSHCKRLATFQSEDIDLARLPHASAIHAVLGYWRSAPACFKLDRIAPLLHHAFDKRFLLIEHLPDSDQLIIRSLGSGYSIFDKKWCKAAAGERFEDQYDIYYARWASHGYRAASEHGTPIIQRLNAVIDKPSTGYRRQRYARIIVPYYQSGRRLLLSASTTNLTMVTRDQ